MGRVIGVEALIAPPTHHHLKTFRIAIDAKSEAHTRRCERLVRGRIHFLFGFGIPAASFLRRVDFVRLGLRLQIRRLVLLILFRGSHILTAFGVFHRRKLADEVTIADAHIDDELFRSTGRPQKIVHDGTLQ
ncbi:hypothetical protein D3C84_598190 [compost metagenome]